MRIIIFIALIITSHCVDECFQQTTYSKCIGVQNLQCFWTGQYCRNSNNYLLGCDANLNLNLCVKQIGDLSGVVSKCIFDTYCHDIYDPYYLKCSDNLSKSGCLAITNPGEHCKWDKGNCLSLTNQELQSLNTIFGQLELSASNCGLINGYLIIHNSILWDLIDYTPDLYTEAQNLVDIEAGKEVTITTSYDENTKLQDNYLDSSNIYHWYTTATQLSIVNIQINDYTRYGCIAQEILTESRFLMLFNLNGIIRGVNHVYCNYLNKHPTTPITTVFINNECIQITEQELQDQTFINENSITCNTMSSIVCQRYYNPQNKCIINTSNEYQCSSSTSTVYQTTCQSLEGIATHFDCVQSDYCYLEISSTQAYCTNECKLLKSQTNCEASTNCIWLGSNLNNIEDSSSSQFTLCSPLNGCDQLGLNYKYCMTIAMNCYWDDDSMRCKSITNIEQLKCNQCNTIYCCSSIIRYDQFCIWTDNQCLNVKDQPLFSHFLSFPTTVIMNFNLCVSQSEQYNYYDKLTHTCQTNGVDLYVQCVSSDDEKFTINNYQCNNGYNDRINKEYCLSLVNSYTRWDQFKLQCLHVTNTNVDCDSLKLVNPNICRYATVAQDKLCLYNQDTWSCYTSNIIDINCDTKGINKEQCTGISDQYCKWADNQCSVFQPYLIRKNYCKDLQNVSASVCKIPLKGQQCIYDEQETSCIVNFTNLSSCEGYVNAIACQSSNEQCYFDNVTFNCLDSSLLLNILTCDTEFISEKTCLGIKTLGQRCFWGTIPADSTVQCRPYISEFYSNCDSYAGSSNINICEALSTNVALQFTGNQFCIVQDNVCTPQTDSLDDSNCGYDKILNIHKCIGQTTEQCYFNNFRCTKLSPNPDYGKILLQQLRCEQTNTKICNLVLTPGQPCYIKEQQKCNQFQPLSSYTCDQLSTFNMNIYNPQLCSIASDACVYDSSRCVIPDPGQIFECDQVGASKTICITQTKGFCIFLNSQCQKMQDQYFITACELRNLQSCSLGGLNCMWNQTKLKCQSSATFCPDSYTDVSWSVCGSANGYCFAGRNGCIEIQSDFDYNDIPCWISLSKSACQSHTKYCQWIDNKCIDYEYSCEDAQTLEKCVLHRSLRCVFKNNKCFEVSNTEDYECNIFDYTSSLFCRYYSPKCIYSTSQYTCSFVNKISDSNQIDSLQIMYGGSYDEQYSCTIQRTEKRYFSWGYCNYGTYYNMNTCETFSSSKSLSMLMCESQPNCAFGLNAIGQSFCYSIPLTCEQMINDFCLGDVLNLNCYQDQDYNCLTYEDQLICEAVQGMKVNYQLCLSIMQNEDNTSKCYYDIQSQECKMLVQENSVNDCTSNQTLFACTFADMICMNSYDQNDEFLECSESAIEFNKDLNLLGCISLQDDKYYFNINKYECQLYSGVDQILICEQLNENACKSLTLDISCVWQSTCQQYLKQFDNITCESRNQKACIQSQNVNCIWYISSCITYDLNFNGDCTSNLCLFSEQSCIYQNLLWDGQQCYSYTSDNLPISFFRCDQLGLNQDLCLNKTQDLTCYWDNYKCQYANLYTIRCDEIISQQTCLSIITPKQTCKWINNNECINTYDSLDCSDYIGLSNCRQAMIQCQFQSASKLCVPKNNIDQFCTSTLSYGACQAVEQEYCMWNDNYCQKWTRLRYSCDQVVNKWGCMNSSMYCKWTGKCENIKETDPISCQLIPDTFNKAACSKYSTGPCIFDEVSQRCDIKLTSSFTTSLDADQSGFFQIRLVYQCTQFTDSEDCIQSQLGQCEWSNDQCFDCGVSQCTNICLNQNQNQCLSLSGYECAWRNNRCVPWIYDTSYEVNQLTLVTEQCCKRLSMLIKYDSSLQSCIQLNTNIDNCETLGLSQYACLNLSQAQCNYKDNRCMSYTFEYKSQCSDYQNVTSYVCQQLPHLSCKYDISHFKCVNVDPKIDTCNTVGISLQGCTSLLNQSCYWVNKQCDNYKISSSVNQCDNSTITNPYTCQLLNYYSQCSYNQAERTCQPRFNQYSQCDEPGLNRLACVSIIGEPCQFINNQCTKITTFTTSCYDLKDVNELACKMNIKDSCAYDPVAKNCLFTLQKLPCTFPGLNQNTCSNQSTCSWDYDNYQCYCNAYSTQSVCQEGSPSLCKAKNNCAFDKQGNYCRLKHCDDLSDCTGSVNGYRCYKDYMNKCQGAKQCEDIINLTDSQSCSEFTFNESACIQILNYCVSANNLEQVCINSDCSSTFCIMQNSICMPLQCSDYSATDCQYYPQCSLIDKQCQEITLCSHMTDETTCLLTSVGNIKCSWVYTGIYEETYHCTSQYCQLYNVSPILCNGNEISSRSCFMDNFQQCRVCEEITDQCTCINSDGACVFSNGICKSILCEQFYNSSDCYESTKCYWSQKDSVCRKDCKYIIKQEDCDAVSYECHWNSYQIKCEQGIAVSPDLSVQITVENIYSVYLLWWAVLILCIQ